MINKYLQLSRRRFQSNKASSILAIIVISLTVMLLNYEGIFLKAVYDAGSDFINNNFDKPPNVDIEFPNLKQELIWNVANNLNIKDFGIIGASKKSIEIDNNIPLVLNYFSNPAMTQLNFVTGNVGCIPDLIKGKLPKAKNEIMFEEDIIKHLNKNLNDKLVINNKEYKLVGICSGDFSEHPENNMAYLKADPLEIARLKCDYTLLVKIRNDVDFNATIKNLTKGISAKDYLLYNEFNLYSQLDFSKVHTLNDYFPIVTNNFRKSIMITGFFWLFALIVISSILRMIILDGLKGLRLLSAIGATQNQIYKIILKEILFISIIGTLIGMIIPIIILPEYKLSLDYYKLITHGAKASLEDLKINFMNFKQLNMINIIISVINILLIYIFSSLTIKLNIRKSTKFSNSNYIKLKSAKLRTYAKKYFKKLFGFKYIILFKGIKSNQAKYMLNTFLITVIVIFTMFIKSYFSEINLNNAENANKFSSNADFTISNDDYSSKDAPKEVELKLNKLKDHLHKSKNNKKIKNIYKYSESNLEVIVSPKYTNINNYENEFISQIIPYEQQHFKTAISVYDNDAFYEYNKDTKSALIEPDKTKDNNGIIWVKNCVSSNFNTFDDNINDVKVGDELNIEVNTEVTDEPLFPTNNMYLNKFSILANNKLKVKVLKTIERNYFTSNPITISNNHIIMSENTFKNIIGEDIIYNGIIITLKDKMYEPEIEQELTALQKHYPTLYLDNINAENRSNNQSNEQFNYKFKISAYIILLLFALISIWIFIITIQINILSDKKELACLISLGISQSKFGQLILSKILMSIIYGTFYGLVMGAILLSIYTNKLNLSTILNHLKNCPFHYIFVYLSVLIVIALISTNKMISNFYKNNLIGILKTEL